MFRSSLLTLIVVRLQTLGVTATSRLFACRHLSMTTPIRDHWKLGRLNHVAIAVPDLNKAASFYKDVLGGKTSEAVVSICSISIHL